MFRLPLRFAGISTSSARLDRHYLTVEGALVCAKIETVVCDRLDRLVKPAEWLTPQALFGFF
jgi:hypothetical protein